jgi:hypothetical protein
MTTELVLNPQVQVSFTESIGQLYEELSTSVEALLWISVDNLINKALAQFSVDKQWIFHETYPQVIHIYPSFISACKHPSLKKSLTDYLHIHRAYYNYLITKSILIRII